MQTGWLSGARAPWCARIAAVAGLSVAIVFAACRYGLAQAEGVPDAVTPHSHAPTAADEPAVGNARDYEVLRRLLGVPGPPVAKEEPAAEPSVVPSAPSDVGAEAAPAATIEASVPAKTTATRKVSASPAPKRAPAVVPARRRTPAPKAVVAEPDERKDAATAPAEAAGDEPADEGAGTGVAAEAPGAGMGVDLPATGQVLRAGDFERYSHLLGPSAQWALLRGAAIRVGATKPIPMEEARAAATQRYHAQVELTPDRRDMRNFVAGIPFPLVTDDDPDAGIKVVLNQQSRLIVDDVDSRRMGCHLASITSEGLDLERTFQVEHWRRLFYLGRLYHQPAPTWANKEGIRYRELQYPLIEPFDLKGGGWNYIRYMDVGRSDDGWIYYPLTRRVRRISTAQRSQGFFGQDMDLDSTTGYSGNPAWMQWRLVGRKTMLASMHSDHFPVKWQAPPADFAADEPWEPRDMYVIEGRSLLKEYAFARRVIYVDRESWLIAYSEIYDNQGKLWKALHQTWGFGSKRREDAGGRTFEEFYLPGYAMIDMQIDHITRCELPLSSAVGDQGWFYNYGDAEGTSETAFDIVSLVGQNH